MIPKEKAIELVEKMFNVDLQCDNEAMCMLYPHAIKCALISVDELISISLPSNEFGGVITNNTTEYWQEVKEEILKL